MQKVYLLLRSNKQTGPYSLEELLQLNLKPFDLVWVEGRSAAWQYPSEIPSLKPFVPETPAANAPFQPIATSAMEEQSLHPTPRFETKTQPLPQPSIPEKKEIPKRVFVSVPNTYNTVNNQPDNSQQSPYERRPLQNSKEKEELKVSPLFDSKSVPSYPEEKLSEEEVRTNYSRSLNDVEEEYTNWMYQNKRKNKASVNSKDLVLAALILAVVGGGYYVMSKPSVTNSILHTNDVAKKTSPKSTENKTEEIETTAPLTSVQNLPSIEHGISTTTEPKSKIIKRKNPLAVPKSPTNSSVPAVQNPMPVEKTTTNIKNNN
jgi:hypothetical protein